MRAATRTAIALLGTLSACGSEAPSSGTTSDLINGADVGPSVVLLNGACTGAKVGNATLLTAAHCVYSSTKRAVSSKYESGATVQLTTVAGEELSAVIKKTNVHPSWLEGCAKTFCGIASVIQNLSVADLALIEFQAPIEGVEAAEILSEPVAVGSQVILGGFGCTDGVRTKGTTLGFSVAKAAVVDIGQARHEGSELRESESKAINGAFFITAGPGLDPDAPGLCPGDSGGPVFVRRDSALLIVGVNSNYTFRPSSVDPKGLPVTNWHSRVDRDSPHRVTEWLAMAGVSSL